MHRSISKRFNLFYLYGQLQRFQNLSLGWLSVPVVLHSQSYSCISLNCVRTMPKAWNAWLRSFVDFGAEPALRNDTPMPRKPFIPMQPTARRESWLVLGQSWYHLDKAENPRSETRRPSSIRDIPWCCWPMMIRSVQLWRVKIVWKESSQSPKFRSRFACLALLFPRDDRSRQEIPENKKVYDSVNICGRSRSTEWMWWVCKPGQSWWVDRRRFHWGFSSRRWRWCSLCHGLRISCEGDEELASAYTPHTLMLDESSARNFVHEASGQ